MLSTAYKGTRSCFNSTLENRSKLAKLSIPINDKHKCKTLFNKKTSVIHVENFVQFNVQS